MEDLLSFENKWDQLHLTEEEDLSIFLEDETTIKHSIKEHRSLVGKLCAD